MTRESKAEFCELEGVLWENRLNESHHLKLPWPLLEWHRLEDEVFQLCRLGDLELRSHPIQAHTQSASVWKKLFLLDWLASRKKLKIPFWIINLYMIIELCWPSLNWIRIDHLSPRHDCRCLPNFYCVVDHKRSCSVHFEQEKHWGRERENKRKGF